MFKKMIGKKCIDAKCKFANQLQDTGLVICPECGGELVPEVVEDKRARAMVTAALALVGLVIGLSGYGWFVKSLSPIRTVEWLIGRIKIEDSFRPVEAQQWVSGDAVFYSQTGPLPRRRDGFIYELVDGKRTSTFRERLGSKTMLQFNVTRSVPLLYMFYWGDGQPKLLFPDTQAEKDVAQETVSIPDKKNLIQLDGAPSQEHFVLIAAKKEVPALESLRVKSDFQRQQLESAVAPLEKDPDTYVLHIYIPHS